MRPTDRLIDENEGHGSDRDPTDSALEVAHQAATRDSEPHDVVEEWGRGSFPASDPPANW